MLLQKHFVGTGNDGFRCAQCGADVPPVTNGSYRNHCPYCLYSMHRDEAPGDRASSCGGLMEPVALVYSRKGYQIVHRCTKCGAERRNRPAEGGLVPDDPDRLIWLSAQPYC